MERAGVGGDHLGGWALDAFDQRGDEVALAAAEVHRVPDLRGIQRGEDGPEDVLERAREAAAEGGVVVAPAVAPAVAHG